jgi:type VI secretion system protein ImpF
MVPAPEGFVELHRSVYEYGLLDSTGVSVGTKVGRERILEALRDTIDRFEPRLMQTKVRLVDADQGKNPQLRFVIQSVLRMDPNHEQVMFDTVLEIASGEFDVHATDVLSASG